MDTISIITGLTAGSVLGLILAFIIIAKANKSKQKSLLKTAKEEGESIPRKGYQHKGKKDARKRNFLQAKRKNAIPKNRRIQQKRKANKVFKRISRKTNSISI